MIIVTLWYPHVVHGWPVYLTRLGPWRKYGAVHVEVVGNRLVIPADWHEVDTTVE